jgi:phosphonoacetaldehyde hydrolase
MKFLHIEAAILDWAGITVDFGSMAPVAALERAFEASGVPITAAEARAHMGVLKKDQVRFICAGKRVRSEWTRCHGQPPSERDVERIFADFLPKQSEILAEYSVPIPGVCETVEAWRSGGLRIGSTTGYGTKSHDEIVSIQSLRWTTATALEYSAEIHSESDCRRNLAPETIRKRTVTGRVEVVGLEFH